MMNLFIQNEIIPKIPVVLLVIALLYTYFYFSPRFFSQTKQKSLQFFVLLLLLMLGIIYIPPLLEKFQFANSSIPAFVIYDVFVLILTFLLFRNQMMVNVIYFITSGDVKDLISGVLEKMEWKNTTVQEKESGTITFTSPGQPFYYEAVLKTDRYIVRPRVVDPGTKLSSPLFRTFSQHLNYQLSAYIEDKEMQKSFRKSRLTTLLFLYLLFLLATVLIRLS